MIFRRRTDDVVAVKRALAGAHAFYMPSPGLVIEWNWPLIPRVALLPLEILAIELEYARHAKPRGIKPSDHVTVYQHVWEQDDKPSVPRYMVIAGTLYLAFVGSWAVVETWVGWGWLGWL